MATMEVPAADIATTTATTAVTPMTMDVDTLPREQALTQTVRQQQQKQPKNQLNQHEQKEMEIDELQDKNDDWQDVHREVHEYANQQARISDDTAALEEDFNQQTLMPYFAFMLEQFANLADKSPTVQAFETERQFRMALNASPMTVGIRHELSTVLTTFHSLVKPKVAVATYVQHLHSTFQPSFSVWLLMWHFLDQLALHLSQRGANMKLNCFHRMHYSAQTNRFEYQGMEPPHICVPRLPFYSMTAHRMILASFTLAYKIITDQPYQNAYLAQQGTISTRELNCLELQLLQVLNWNVSVDIDCHARYRWRLMEAIQVRHMKAALFPMCHWQALYPSSLPDKKVSSAAAEDVTMSTSRTPSPQTNNDSTVHDAKKTIS